MAEYLLELMKRIAVFTVISQAILHFRPNKSYEKYLRLLIGIIMLAIFMVPITELFHTNSMQEYELMLEGYEKSIDRMYETSDFQMDLKEETYLYTLQEEMKTRFNNISDAYGYEVESVSLQGISMDAEQNITAQPEKGSVQVVLRDKNAGISTVQVDKIKLGNNKTEKVSGEISEQLNADIPMLREKFAESIGVGEDFVMILWKS